MRLKFLFILPILLIYLNTEAQRPERLPNRQFSGFIQLEAPIPSDQVRTLLSKRFQLSQEDELSPFEVSSDLTGIRHEKFQQLYRGIPVEGAILIAHSKHGLARVMNGNFFHLDNLDTSPQLSADEALHNALEYISGDKYAWEDTLFSSLMQYEYPSGELVIVPGHFGDKSGRLAYKFDLFALEPMYRADIYIDANDGSFIRENLRIHHQNTPASGNALYEGQVSFVAENTGSFYRLRETSESENNQFNANVETYNMNNGTNYGNATDFTSSAPNSWSDEVAVQAHWGAEKTYAYFLEKFNRASFDGNGSPIKSYVHYSTNYDNAFWNGSVMTYGDGNNFNPLVSLDVVGHEITHGVTDYEADLVYSYESGALNESFSDIFAEVIEHYAKGSNDWKIGAEITPAGNGIRSMSNPNLFSDPDTYLGDYWYQGSGDNGGVHINSGVQNFWFYLLVNGGSGTNDRGDAYSVTGIGMEDAAAIAYLNLTEYLTPNSQYSDAMEGSIQAAIALFGEGSPQVLATEAAWEAVGVKCSSENLCYCTSRGSSSRDEWIQQLEIGAFVNATENQGPDGYTDYTDLIIDLDPGQTYSLSLTPAFSGVVWDEWWRIWIDYNADGDFNDEGELAFDAGTKSKETVTGTITIPPDLSGITRMRVSMKYNSASTPCEAFSYGEVEDYTVQFSEVPPPSPPPPPPPPPPSPEEESCISITTSFDIITLNNKDNLASIMYSTPQEDVLFTISGLDEKISENGNPKNNYTEIVTVSWWDEYNKEHSGGTYSGADLNTQIIDLQANKVKAIRVTLSNGQNTSGNGMSVSLSSISSCDPGGGNPTDCTQEFYNFEGDVLVVPPGTGAGSTLPLVFDGIRNGASFTISGLDAKDKGKESNKVIEEVTVIYDNGSGEVKVAGTFNAQNHSDGSVTVHIFGEVLSITVLLKDVYDDNTDDPALDITFSAVETCIPAPPIIQMRNSLDQPKLSANEIHFYPNPATDQLTVRYSLEVPEQVRILITDLSGRPVKIIRQNPEAGIQKSILNINDLPAGIYLLHLWKGDQRQTKRFVVLK